jgi:AraC family transcriptional regulator, ethanolamine operon transcriptional activator
MTVFVARRRVITDIDELVDTIDSARTAPKTLRPGAIRAEVAHADLGDVLVEVGDYSFPIATAGETATRRIGMFVPLRRAVSGHFKGEALTPDVLHVWGENAEIAGVIGEPARFGIVSFAPEALDRTAEALGIELDLPGRGEVRPVRAVDWPRLDDAFEFVLRTARDRREASVSDAGTTALAELLVELAVRSVAIENNGPVHGPRTRLNSLRVVRACEDHAARARYQGVTLADLCVASSASERWVRHAFHDCFGMSPTSYLRVIALHEVRHALLHELPGYDTVGRAASDFGFWHLGRFAAQYRALFGESPSTTLGRRLRAVT